jgi:hypothetical protein
MVLLQSEEEALLNDVAQRRGALASQSARWQTHGGARRALERQSLEQWQAEAAEFTANSNRVLDASSRLYTSQRLAWKKDDAATRREVDDLHVQVTRSLIAFRAEERAERLADRPAVTLDQLLTKQLGSHEFARRAARRARAGSGHGRGWPPARPSTAPARPSTAPARPSTADRRDRAPPSLPGTGSSFGGGQDMESFTLNGSAAQFNDRVAPQRRRAAVHEWGKPRVVLAWA